MSEENDKDRVRYGLIPAAFVEAGWMVMPVILAMAAGVFSWIISLLR